jgi:hypothetical protein
MELSMTVTDAWLKEPHVLQGKSTDLNGDAWTFEFRFGGYYSTEMADGIFRDITSGRFPFLRCTYAEPRDRYMVVDDHGNEVSISRFSDWNRIG